jgi:hypothetical protein
MLIVALIARPGVLPACLTGVLVVQTCLVQSLLAGLADNTALYGAGCLQGQRPGLQPGPAGRGGGLRRARRSGRPPRGNPIGWLMLAESAGLVIMTLASTYCLLGVTTFPGELPAARQAGTLAESGFASVVFIIVLMFLLFPTGKLPSRRWRPVAAAGIAATALSTIGLVLAPRLVEIPAPGGISATFAAPFGTPRLPSVLIGTIIGLGVVVVPFLAASFVSLAVRYRAGSWLLR